MDMIKSSGEVRDRQARELEEVRKRAEAEMNELHSKMQAVQAALAQGQHDKASLEAKLVCSFLARCHDSVKTSDVHMTDAPKDALLSLCKMQMTLCFLDKQQG